MSTPPRFPPPLHSGTHSRWGTPPRFPPPPPPFEERSSGIQFSQWLQPQALSPIDMSGGGSPASALPASVAEKSARWQRYNSPPPARRLPSAPRDSSVPPPHLPGTHPRLPSGGGSTVQGEEVSDASARRGDGNMQGGDCLPATVHARQAHAQMSEGTQDRDVASEGCVDHQSVENVAELGGHTAGSSAPLEQTSGGAPASDASGDWVPKSVAFLDRDPSHRRMSDAREGPAHSEEAHSASKHTQGSAVPENSKQRPVKSPSQSAGVVRASANHLHCLS